MSGAETILGVVAGGAGLLSLAIQLAENARKVKGFYNDYRGAPDTLQDLAFDLETMSLSMRLLEQHRQQDNHDGALLDRCILKCQKSCSKIAEVVGKMNKYTAKSQRMGKAYMVFKERDINKLLAELDQARGGLQFAFAIYHAQERARQAVETREMHDVSNSVVDVGWCEKSAHTTSVARMHAKPRRGSCFNTRISLPAWLSSQVWHLAMSNADGGWDFCIRTYTVRPRDTEIFNHCSIGDLPTVQRLLTSGEASFLDVDAIGETLVQKAAEGGHLELSRWLLTQISWPDQGQVISRSLDFFAIHKLDRSNIKDLVELGFRAFLEETEWDFDLENTTAVPLRTWRISQRVLDIMIKNSMTAYDDLPLQDRLEYAGTVLKNDRFGSLSSYLANIGLERSSAQLSTARTSSGDSVLHHVALRLSEDLYPHADLSRYARHIEWRDFGRGLLEKAPLSIVTCVGGDSQATPLLNALFYSRSYNTSARISGVVKTWAEMVADSGIDLASYGQEEQDAWHAYWHQKSAKYPGLAREESYELAWGARVEDWDVHVRTTAYCLVYELQQIPGAFPTHPQVPRTIIWSPGLEESDEGKWELATKGRSLLSTPSRSRNRPQQSLHALSVWRELLRSTQDDAGPIMLLNCRSASDRSGRRRSLSEPSTSRRGVNESIEDDYSAMGMHWLPPIHRCLSDSKVRVVTSADSVDVARACLRGECQKSTTIYGGKYGESWSINSFLARICACQDAKFVDYLHETKFVKHTGRSGCPQGCDRVRLDKLNVPEALRTFHPRRQRKWSSAPFSLGPEQQPPSQATPRGRKR